MKTSTCNLVGAYFRPPAQAIINHLPAGAELVLEAEPSNEYDPNAVKVLGRPSDVPREALESFREALAGYGETPEWLPELVHLGYLNSKPPKDNLLAPCAQTIAPRLAKHVFRAVLGFNPEGKPLVQIQWGE